GHALAVRRTSRPIAGTRRRGRTGEEDRRMVAELTEHPKERAEHVMLVDLARNDVGRVVAFGTETVDELMTLERYSHVMHLTSQVSGRLREGLGPIDVLRATLPAGTVSGAPKVRAMEIIDELEPTKRGPYAGVVGYLDFSGNLDTAIAIRTMLVHPDARDRVRVSGPEAAEFLQGQLSQDIAPMSVGDAAWSFVLQPQGKVDVFVRVTRAGDDDFVLDTDEGWGERLAQRLTRFKLRTKVD